MILLSGLYAILAYKLFRRRRTVQQLAKLNNTVTSLFVAGEHVPE